MKILALDIALSVGWAYGDGTPEGTNYNTKVFNSPTDYGCLSADFSIWIADKLTVFVPDLVAIERNFFRGANSYHLGGMVWDAHRVCWLRCVPRVEYAPKQIKKFIAESGGAEKDTVLDRIRNLGFHARTDHEGDALALLLLARERAEERKAA